MHDEDSSYCYCAGTSDDGVIVCLARKSMRLEITPSKTNDRHSYVSSDKFKGKCEEVSPC